MQTKVIFKMLIKLIKIIAILCIVFSIVNLILTLITQNVSVANTCLLYGMLSLSILSNLYLL